MWLTKKVDGPFRNAVLRQLDPPSIERLHLMPVPLEGVRRCLTVPGQNLDRIFFVETGFVSVAVPLKDGTQISAGILGSRSLVGASALLGASTEFTQYLVSQWAGEVYASSVEDAQREFERNELFRQLALQSIRTQLVQATQLSACNSRHDVEQRISRWLLLCHDEMAGGDIFTTHEVLAGALGICRTTATMALDLLRRNGVLDSGRAHIRVLDRSGLERRACECYAIVRDSYLEPVARDSHLPDKRRPSPVVHLPVNANGAADSRGLRKRAGRKY